MIEVLIVMGLVAVVGGFALFVSMESYRGSSFHSDRDLLIAALQRARAEAVDNICFGTCTDGKPHGVFMQSTSTIIFQGASFATRDIAADAVFDANTAVTKSSLGEIVFSQLSGTTTATSTTLSDGIHSSVVSVGAEGQIIWTN